MKGKMVRMEIPTSMTAQISSSRGEWYFVFRQEMVFLGDVHVCF